jgi:uncharacterized delta-60 repeat protein
MKRLHLCLATVVATLAATAPLANARPGDLDPSFSGDGFAQIDFADSGPGLLDPTLGTLEPIGLAEDGDVLLGGPAIYRPTGCSFGGCFGEAHTRLARLNPDGSLDPTLGGSGTVESGFGGSSGTAAFTSGLFPDAFAVQPSGEILIAAQAGQDGTVVRITPGGSLDPTFGEDGKRTIDLPESVRIQALAVDDQGRIAVGGSVDVGATAGDKDLLIARLTPNGDFDPTFGGGDGVVTESVAPYDSVDQLAFDGAGRIVAAGESWNAQPFAINVAVLRLTVDGALDTSFGGGTGALAFDPRPEAASNATVTALAIDAQNRPLVLTSSLLDFSAVGPDDPGVHRDLARLRADGTLDPTMGGDGVRELVIPGDSPTASFGAGAMVLQNDGRIVLGGSAGGPVVIRLTADGNPDQSFGEFGIARVDSPFAPSYGAGLLIDNAGRIVLGGATQESRRRAQVAAFRTDTNSPDDADADGVLDPGDRCRTFYAPPAGCPEHDRAVTIHRTPEGLAGVVRSKWAPCVWGVRMTVYRKRPGPDRWIGLSRRASLFLPFTAGEVVRDRWVFAERKLAGRLYARVKATTDPVPGVCSRTKSRTVTVRR